MAKSVQDLCMWMKDLQDKLYPKVVDISIEVKGKGFFMWGIQGDNPEIGTEALLSGEDLEDTDINDLPYLDPVDVAKIIIDNLSVQDLKVEDL